VILVSSDVYAHRHTFPRYAQSADVYFEGAPVSRAIARSGAMWGPGFVLGRANRPDLSPVDPYMIWRTGSLPGRGRAGRGSGVAPSLLMAGSPGWPERLGEVGTGGPAEPAPVEAVPGGWNSTR
jgi:hypothetical protein